MLGVARPFDVHSRHLDRLLLGADADACDVGLELRRLHKGRARLIDIDEAEIHQRHDDERDDPEQCQQRAHVNRPLSVTFTMA
ncbi:hypothetical protein MOP88_04800 [Sphingomonas sp. WKB10]|nr:hypothetical protein [Sphingomonas sp. WKB10]